jgi:hypothetical protein
MLLNICKEMPGRGVGGIRVAVGETGVSVGGITNVGVVDKLPDGVAVGAVEPEVGMTVGADVCPAAVGVVVCPATGGRVAEGATLVAAAVPGKAVLEEEVG